MNSFFDDRILILQFRAFSLFNIPGVQKELMFLKMHVMLLAPIYEVSSESDS